MEYMIPIVLGVLFKVILGQQRSKSENLVNTITSERKGGETSYLVCRICQMGVHHPYCFWAQSEVIWVNKGQSLKTLLTLITSERKGADTSYLVCRLAIWST